MHVADHGNAAGFCTSPRLKIWENN